MQTPGMLLITGLAGGAIERATNFARCVKQAEAFEKAGASHVILSPLAIDGDADRGVRAALEAFVR